MDIIQEIENGTVTANYIRTLNIDEPLARIKNDGTIRYYQQDAIGSIIALTDENGTIKTQYKYSPFGDIEIIGEQSDNPFQFAGRENDGTGLLSERARYYSIKLQRYISEDPIGLDGGDINFFIRVGNNPINFIDPYGLSWCKAWCITKFMTKTIWVVVKTTVRTLKCVVKRIGNMPSLGRPTPAPPLSCYYENMQKMTQEERTITYEYEKCRFDCEIPGEICLDFGTA
jgi:RHS repeat-associated protein